MNTKYDFNLLAIFLEVYQQRSITLAAESLNSTQPSISNALKRLQKTMNTELFVREGRGISPTSAAIQLAKQIAPAYDTIENALNNINGAHTQIAHTFRVLVNEPLMNLLQPLAEKDSTMGNYNIEFQICPDNEDDIFQQLSLQKVDLAIDIGLLSTPSYNREFFFQDKLFITARKGHPRIHGEIDLQTFYAEKHITMKIRRIQSHVLSYISQDAVKNRIISCETNSLLSLLGHVSKSDCIGLASQTMLDQYEDILNLQRIPAPFKYHPIDYNMVWHKRNDNQAAQIWLREKLRSLLL